VAVKQTEESHPIPGLDVVGRGIFLNPHQPDVLRPVLSPHTKMRRHHSPETGQTYTVPHGYAVNESPPMPAKQALNRVVIEESFERFEKQFALDTKVASSVAIFSIDANAGQARQVRSEEDAYYALRLSFVPLWALYLSESPVLSEKHFAHLPTRFVHRDRAVYDGFFERHGTHYVQRAWVGGQAKLVFTVLKSSNMSKQDIQVPHTNVCTVWGSGRSAIQ
jgi:hypothetical protein